MPQHVLQSPQWAEFKKIYGTPSVNAGNVWYTKHTIPFTGFNYAYAARVDPRNVNFEELKKSLEENKCIAIHFDVPNITKGSSEEKECIELFESNCVKSPRDEFAKGNIFIDLTKSEDELMSQMHQKQRYNIKYAQKKGVTSRISTEKKDFESFYEVYKDTSLRQHFYPRSKYYFEKMFEVFQKDNNIHILLTEFEGKALATWLLFTYEDTLYYPYGGSLEVMKNLQASCLIGWEAILFGKKMGLKNFDMWGASEDPNNEKDPYYGFTNFKTKFGGKHVVYISSYDMVVNEGMYKLFNSANSLRWKLLNFLR
jgi:lipid II:glycine glycyltransferase (peptidoglycan interpeptide bridge formation enzyme)